MNIAVAKADSKFERYLKWLDVYNVKYEIIQYGNGEPDIKKLDDCSGLMLCGGKDIYPEIYCDWDSKDSGYEYNPERDGFELNLLEKAIKRKIPVLGICRGLQLMNVHFRGSLIFDLEEIRGVNHKKITPEEDRLHDVRIFSDTLLYKITGVENTVINSSHHQAIDRLGEGLMINAKSDDGIIEGIEYADKTNKPFFIGVQWHPERFKDFDSPVSKNILDKFISECEKYT